MTVSIEGAGAKRYLGNPNRSTVRLLFGEFLLFTTDFIRERTGSAAS